MFNCPGLFFLKFRSPLFPVVVYLEIPSGVCFGTPSVIPLLIPVGFFLGSLSRFHQAFLKHSLWVFSWDSLRASFWTFFANSSQISFINTSQNVFNSYYRVSFQNFFIGGILGNTGINPDFFFPEISPRIYLLLSP